MDRPTFGTIRFSLYTRNLETILIVPILSRTTFGTPPADPISTLILLTDRTPCQYRYMSSKF